MMQPMDMSDAFVESNSDKIKAILADGTALVLEKFSPDFTEMECEWKLSIKRPSEKHYGSLVFTKYQALADTLFFDHDVTATNEIWLPIEIANQQEDG